MTPHEKLIETVARAICEASAGPFELFDASGQEAFRFDARAAIAAIYEEMREPSDAVASSVIWGGAALGNTWVLLNNELWQAMLSASPLNPEAGT